MKYSASRLLVCLCVLIALATFPEAHAQPNAGENCDTDIVTAVPEGVDWNNVFLVRGEDGSAWQRAIVSNGGGILELNEFAASNIYGIGESGADVQVFVFSPQYDAADRMAKPDIATCFIADTMWRTTEGERNTQIEGGYYALPMASRVLWPSIGQELVVDAFFRRKESWDEIMRDDRYRQFQNFYVGTHLKPTVLEIAGSRDDAKCQLLCEEGPAIGVELDPDKLPKKLKGRVTNFNNVNGKTVMVGRMPGIHTFYAGFKDGSATQRDKAALRVLAHQAMGMEALKRALLGNRNANGRAPGLPFLSADQFEAAVTGRNQNVSLDTVQLLRSAARLLISGKNDPFPPIPYPELTTRDQPDFNPFNPGAPIQTPTPTIGQAGATPVATITPIDVGGVPIPPGMLPGLPGLPGQPPNVANSLADPTPLPSESPFLGYLIPPPVPESSLNFANENVPIGMPAPPPPAPNAPINQPLIPSDPNAPTPPPPPTLGGNAPPQISEQGVDYPVETPVGTPNVPMRPLAPPPGRGLFDGIQVETSRQLLDTIVNRGQVEGLPALLFPEHSSMDTWAEDLIQLINFWTGSLKVNPCLLADDTFLVENFVDQPEAFTASSCENYVYVSGLTPRLVLHGEQPMTLTPDFKDAIITKTDIPFDENSSWSLPEGKKKTFKYLYEFTSRFPDHRVGKSCVKGDQVPEFINLLKNALSLRANEVTALAQELHEEIKNPDAYYSVEVADPAEIAKRLVWKVNGKELDLLRLFFKVEPNACEQSALSLPDIVPDKNREGFEAGVL